MGAHTHFKNVGPIDINMGALRQMSMEETTVSGVLASLWDLSSWGLPRCPGARKGCPSQF